MTSTRPSSPSRPPRRGGRRTAGRPTARRDRSPGARDRAGRRAPESRRAPRRVGLRPRPPSTRADRAARPVPTSSSGSRPAAARATASHRAGAFGGTSSSSSHAGTVSMSSSRGRETATNPSRARTRWQLPPQLVAPRRHRPMRAARSPRSASGSRPAKGRASSSSPSTRRWGGPSGLFGRSGERHGATGRPAFHAGVDAPRQGNVWRSRTSSAPTHWLPSCGERSTPSGAGRWGWCSRRGCRRRPS